jgi:uroporphyrinogen-III synthase
MPALEGRRVGLLESRRAEELGDLVSRLGGIPTFAPAVREVSRPDDSRRVIDRLTSGRFDVVILLTAAGISALLDEASRLGLERSVVDALRRMTIVCRGPKPVGVLKRHALAPAIVTARPHTTRELIGALEALSIDGSSLLLIHYGERNAQLADTLAARGANLDEVCLYEWAMPDDVEPLRALVRDAIARRIDAVLFTSQIQFRHFMRVALQMDASGDVIDALQTDIVVGAVGPVCAAALRESGVIADVIPALSNSPSLVRTLGEYFELTQPEPET